MKVMGIGAGRRNGNSEIAVKEALLACQEAGAECTYVNLFDYNMIHCTGCEACTGAMGEIAMGKRDDYPGCVLKEKDDVDKLVNALQSHDGVIIGCPTYDLMPSAKYTTFAQRWLAYEVSFLVKIGVLKKNPNLVGGLIAVGGSCHDWQSLSLESMAATMFTQSIQVVDQYMVTRSARPGNILLRDGVIERCRKMGKSIVKAIQTPVEGRKWLGDPDLGLCPNCHGGLVFRGEEHWDGVKFPFECAVCGAGGDLVRDEAGKIRFVLAENGLMKNRNNNEGRERHLEEIMKTKIHYMQNLPTVAEGREKYKSLQFGTVK
jgi:multimeric flavodoxin WrbA